VTLRADAKSGRGAMMTIPLQKVSNFHVVTLAGVEEGIVPEPMGNDGTGN